MNTIALRYSDQFAPLGGTIKAHENIIQENGFVWFGKIGNGVSEKTRRMILQNTPAEILLFCGGNGDKYWASVSKIQKEMPLERYIPKYYNDKYIAVGTWFCITDFIKAPPDILRKCMAISSGMKMSDVARYNNNSLFVISYMED